MAAKHPLESPEESGSGSQIMFIILGLMFVMALLLLHNTFRLQQLDGLSYQPMESNTLGVSQQRTVQPSPSSANPFDYQNPFEGL